MDLKPFAAAAGGSQAGKTEARAANPRMREAAEEFEAIFIAQILNGMSVGLEGSGPMSGDDGDAFAGMLRDEHAKLISRSGGIGIADAVLKEMLKMQEVG